MLADKFNAFQGEEHQPFTLDGGKPAALLVHGFPGSPAEMRPLAETIHEAGWTARVLLLPGFGADFENVIHRTCEDWVKAVRDELVTLQKQYSPVVLIGHSMGGAISLKVAATTPPDALVLTAPFWKVDHIAWKALPVIQIFFPQPKLFKYLNLDFDKQDVRDGIHNFLPNADLDDPEVRDAIINFRVPVKMFAQIRRAGIAAHEVAPRVNAPTLVIQGRRDELVKPAMTQQFIKRIKGKVTYCEVDAEHDPILPSSTGWTSTQEHVRTFLRQFEREGVS